MRSGKFGGITVGESEFAQRMNELGAAEDADWTVYRIYDPVYGEVLEQYQNWRGPDRRTVGRIEQYYSREVHYLRLIFTEEWPDTLTAG
jgi:hypothetical protein